MILKWSFVYLAALLVCLSWRTGSARRKSKLLEIQNVPDVITSAIVGKVLPNEGNDKKSAISGKWFTMNSLI